MSGEACQGRGGEVWLKWNWEAGGGTQPAVRVAETVSLSSRIVVRRGLPGIKAHRGSRGPGRPSLARLWVDLVRRVGTLQTDVQGGGRKWVCGPVGHTSGYGENWQVVRRSQAAAGEGSVELRMQGLVSEYSWDAEGRGGFQGVLSSAGLWG